MLSLELPDQLWEKQEKGKAVSIESERFCKLSMFVLFTVVCICSAWMIELMYASLQTLFLKIIYKGV